MGKSANNPITSSDNTIVPKCPPILSELEQILVNGRLKKSILIATQQSLLMFMLPLLFWQWGEAIMWSRTPAAPAPERHLCTADEVELQNSPWPELLCVCCDPGHDVPKQGSGSYIGQFWRPSLLVVEHATTMWMAPCVAPETLACSHPAPNISQCHAPG